MTVKNSTKKKSFKVPHTYVIIFSILLLVALATYIIPAGEYERQENASGRTVVVENSYHHVERSPQGISKVLQAPLDGIKETSSIIGFILIVGGAFAVVQKTKAIDAGIIKVTQRLKGYEILIIPAVMVLFSLGGAVFGMSEEIIPFVAIFVPLALALGYDTITGVAMCYVGAHIGFAAAFMNPFTVGIAQGIAELPPMSAMGYRLFVWAVTTIVGVAYVMIYANKIKKNPELSITFEHDQKRRKEFSKEATLTNKFTGRHALVLTVFFIGIVTLVSGVIIYEWWISEIAAIFVAMGIVAGLAGGLKPGEIADSFIDGARDLVGAALIVGLARGTLILATNGKIIDTVLASVVGVIGNVPSVISAYLMFFIQSIINFFVPSGSGQAALTMPIMAPLGELVGITRQTTVLAFQFGDGFTNMIIPTSGVLMGALGMAKISWDQWAKWMVKLQILFLILGCLLLTPAVLMHLGPF